MFRENVFLVSALKPPVQQRRMAAAVAAALFLVFLTVLPFKDRQWPRQDAFIPIVDSILFLNDLLTAVLLYAQYSVLRNRALLALAMGYLFAAFIIVLHLLTFPGALSTAGLLSAGLQSTVWLYILWHFGVPLAVIAYSLLKYRPISQVATPESTRVAILASIIAVAGLALVSAWLVTAAKEILPVIMLDSIRGGTFWGRRMAPVILLTSAGAIALLWRRRSSVLDMWLLLVLWAWFIETLLLTVNYSRFSMVWYVGRGVGVLASSLVLIVLLYESMLLYARLALAAGEEDRERERQRLTLEVIVGSIAHELTQPLSAIVTNSDAGRKLLAHSPPNLAETSAALDDIAVAGRRANDIIKSIRATLTGAELPMAPIDMSQLVRESLNFLRIELLRHDILVQLDAATPLPPIRGNKSQLLQVLANLITNALEAMIEVTDRPRVLCIRSALCSPPGVSVTVEDSGRGVDAEHESRIFEPLFTTKSSGQGLGLAICRTIIESHGGRISATRGKVHGSVFQIVLPASEKTGSRSV
jgi:signal transduction histidine kinase